MKAIQCICVDTDSKMPGTHRAIRLVFRLIFHEIIEKQKPKEKKIKTHSRETKALVTVIVYSIRLKEKKAKTKYCLKTAQ